MEKQVPRRLESLDALRGFDLFCLVVLEGGLYSLDDVLDVPWFEHFMWYFKHVDWAGFSSWDLVMPLFLFMSGVSIPFALSKYQSVSDKTVIYKRIIKRVILLWIFGMICEGNLLGLDPSRMNLYSNTLQSIAMGYLIASMVFLHMKLRYQIVTAIVLLLTYWGIMEFVVVGNYGGGNYSPEYNMAEWIDRVVLGRFRNFSSIVDGAVTFADSYHYTWVLSSLNFGVTTLTGLFAGELLKSKVISDKRKYITLFVAGLIMICLGWIWNFELPVIKKIWTSSMVLISSGYCFLLMSLFYYVIDYKGYRRNLTWLKIYGMNSIVAYMLTMCISFHCIAQSLFYGLEQYLGVYYSTFIVLMNALIIFLILRYLYRNKIFLRV